MTKNLFLVSLTFFGMILFSLVAAGADILFLAGEPSHGWDSHNHHAGARLLAEALNKSGLEISVAVVYNAWPEDPATFYGVKTIVVYSDGKDSHVLEGHAEDIQALSEKGVGLVLLHYAVEVNPGPLQPKLLEWIGGYFEVNWSVNPTWLPKNITLGKHPVTQGVAPFAIRDEWYFHMRFRPEMDGVTPIITAVIPPDTITQEDNLRGGNPTLRDELSQGIPQHLAWVASNKHGGRGFGFTGTHYHRSWANDDLRKLVLNAIVWTANVAVPEDGVRSETPIIVQHETILRAVAKGDAQDVLRHCLLGVDVNEPNESGWTPLLYAAARNQPGVCKILIEQGANVNVVAKSKSTAVHLAIERNAGAVLQLLLERDADLSLRDGNGWTPLHLAAAKNQVDTIRLLLKNGAAVNALSDAGGTPLHEAAASAGTEAIQLLLDHDIDPTVVSRSGTTARDIALEFNNTAAIELLGN